MNEKTGLLNRIRLKKIFGVISEQFGFIVNVLCLFVCSDVDAESGLISGNSGSSSNSSLSPR